jgi:hypothetical protein
LLVLELDRDEYSRWRGLSRVENEVGVGILDRIGRRCRKRFIQTQKSRPNGKREEEERGEEGYRRREKGGLYAR